MSLNSTSSRRAALLVIGLSLSGCLPADAGVDVSDAGADTGDE
jgi:hypothetical protein